MRPELELITTGAELLSGRTVNRHAQWLGGALDKIGWRLTRDTTVPDNHAAIADALASACVRSRVVICTGGLGPTSDDVTRDVAASWAGAGIVMHEPSRQLVRDIYARRRKPLNDMVERHALVVEGARVLENAHGLAPGEHLEKRGQHVFLLPGPPREFQGVMNDHVLPWLDGLGIGSRARRQVFQVAGMGESDIVAAMIADGYDDLQVDTAYCAAPSRVSIRIDERPAWAGDFDRAVALVERVMGPAIFARADVSLEEIVLETLMRHGRTLAVAESCTGGWIGQRLTAVAGSSAVFRGGVIAYHNEVKMKLLGVEAQLLADCGAVSEEVARAMATGVRQVCGADYGLAVTGIAGPGGGSADKPVGTVWLAVADERQVCTRSWALGGGRDAVREASALLALDLLRRFLI